jgi:hypothetical protein
MVTTILSQVTLPGESGVRRSFRYWGMSRISEESWDRSQGIQLEISARAFVCIYFLSLAQRGPLASKRSALTGPQALGVTISNQVHR